MGFFDFLNRNGNIPMPGTSAYNAYLRSTGHTDSYGRSAYSAQQSIPPVGTSARNSYEAVLETAGNSDSLSSAGVPVISSFNSAKPISNSSIKPQTLDYLNAELASAYGMSRSTAYQEALSNTAYQRAVKDMKAAGLNPAVLFGAGRGSSANSSIYASESSGSSRSSGYGRSSSAKGQLFSSSAYSALSAIGGLVGIALTGKPDGFWIGSQTSQGAMALLNAASSASRK